MNNPYIRMRHLLRRLTVLFPQRPLAPRPLPAGGESAPRDALPLLLETLRRYDVLSFDVFDTLLLRPFSAPQDLFDFLGAALGYPYFKTLRVQAEQQTRRHIYEPTLTEIWETLAGETGLNAARGAALEYALEQRFCQANPYLLPAIWQMHREGKRLIALSDMYLSQQQMRRLLQDYPPFEAYFISSEQRASKHDGSLFAALRAHIGGASCLHMGDNPYADGVQARRAGLTTLAYPSVPSLGDRFRTRDMSPLVGSVYRGLVNARLHSGEALTKAYELGFAYGGLLVLGFVRFICREAERQGADTLLFLARDGYLLQRVYTMLHPEAAERALYVPWSRLAALKICADGFRHEYVKRFIYHKAGSGIRVAQALEAMELKGLTPPVDGAALLTHKTAGKLKDYLLQHWPQVLASYEEQRVAAGLYFKPKLKDARRALAVDIGWVGSGPLLLRYAVQTLWRLPCRITGVMAGTTSASAPEGDAAAPFITSGLLGAYLFDAATNRDLWRFHNAARGHNLYFELLLSAPEPSLQGFYLTPSGAPHLVYRRPPRSAALTRQIQQGALDFIRQFTALEQRLGYELPISGRDAYAPMLQLLKQKNYLKDWEVYLDEPGV